jgi:hypothetical protein
MHAEEGWTTVTTRRTNEKTNGNVREILQKWCHDDAALEQRGERFKNAVFAVFACMVDADPSAALAILSRDPKISKDIWNAVVRIKHTFTVWDFNKTFLSSQNRASNKKNAQFPRGTHKAATKYAALGANSPLLRNIVWGADPVACFELVHGTNQMPGWRPLLAVEFETLCGMAKKSLPYDSYARFMKAMHDVSLDRPDWTLHNDVRKELSNVAARALLNLLGPS